MQWIIYVAKLIDVRFIPNKKSSFMCVNYIYYYKYKYIIYIFFIVYM